MYVDSFYENSYPKYEHVNDLNHSQRYVVSDTIWLDKYLIFIYLINDRYTGKCNIYVIDDYLEDGQDLKFVMKHFLPLSLEFALFLFPSYGFTHETYGF